MDIVASAKQLLAASDELSDQPTWRYDVTDVTRQVLQDYARQLLPHMATMYRAGDREEFETLSDRFLEIFDDMDRLLAANPDFLLGRWLANARTKGQGNRRTANQLERAARYLITQWAEDGWVTLSDYSNRQWSGLMSDYYKPRWEAYLITARKSLRSGSSLETWKERWEKSCRKIERRWIESSGNPYPIGTQGDTVELVREMLAKYEPAMGQMTQPGDEKARAR